MSLTEVAAIRAMAHYDAMTVTLRNAARELDALLSRPLTAFLAGVRDPELIGRWADGETASVSAESEQRLRTAYEILRLLLQFEGADTVRAWFIGMNPQLDDASAIEVIHQGRLQEALDAALSFAGNG